MRSISHPRVALALLVLALALPALAAAQTTGEIVGIVHGDADSVMPGVTVEATSPVLQGTRSTISDEHGAYRLNFLPPGSYAVTFTLAGFRKEQGTAAVSLGRDSSSTSPCGPRRRRRSPWSATAPVIDTTTTTVGTNLGHRRHPVAAHRPQLHLGGAGGARHLHRREQQQPRPDTITVYGSSGSENVYYVDGVNTTNLEYGFQGKELNFEFIQEIEVKTGGYEAEYGKATGGVINVITKSGGNEFHGDVFGYRDDDNLQDSAKDTVSTTGMVKGYTRQARAPTSAATSSATSCGSSAPTTTSTTASTACSTAAASGCRRWRPPRSKRDLGAFKLTYRINDNHTLIGSYLQDPRTDSGAINDSSHTLNGTPPTYLGEQKSPAALGRRHRVLLAVAGDLAGGSPGAAKMPS